MHMEWERCNDLPGHGSSMFSAYAKGVLFVGRGYTEDLNDRRKLFKTSDLNTWGLLPPTPVTAYGATVHAGNVLMVGGLTADGGAPGKTVLAWMCDPMSSSNAITLVNIPYLPCKRSHLGMTTIHNTWILAVGGFVENGAITNNCDVLRIGETSWRPLPPLLKPLYSPSCLFLSGRIYVMGGYANSNPLEPNKDVFCFDWNGTMRWETLCQAPAENCVFASLGGSLVCIGKDPEKYATAIWTYSEKTAGKWLKLGELPEYLYRCTATTAPTGEVILIGSNKSTGGYSRVYKGKISFQ